jgi:hypothetical protein
MIKHIHAETKMELAEKIFNSAPADCRGFKIVQKLPPQGYLVEYGREGLSVEKLGIELGLTHRELKPVKLATNAHKELWADIRANRVRQYGGYVIK